MKRFHVTYDLVTPESAEHGDTEDNGFLDYCGARHTCAPFYGERAQKLKDAVAMRLRDAINLIGHLESGGDGSSYYESDGRQKCRTGEEERRAFHVPRNATASSLARIQRLLRSKRLLSR